eukprot:9956276-Alexandrium_andersonii.AAC.1
MWGIRVGNAQSQVALEAHRAAQGPGGRPWLEEAPAVGQRARGTRTQTHTHTHTGDTSLFWFKSHSPFKRVFALGPRPLLGEPPRAQ